MEKVLERHDLAFWDMWHLAIYDPDSQVRMLIGLLFALVDHPDWAKEQLVGWLMTYSERVQRWSYKRYREMQAQRTRRA